MSTVVLALHSSASPASMWRFLERIPALAGVSVIAPSLLGYPPNPPVALGERIGLSADAAHVRALLPADVTALHLVGHSYGGLVALRLAAELAPILRSIWVYEPVIFGALRNDPASDPEARAEALAFFTSPESLAADFAGFEAWCGGFIDYWNGAGTFDRMSAKARAGVTAVGGKLVAELYDIFYGTDTFADWHRASPLTIAYGAATRRPAVAMAHGLARANPHAALDEIAEASHMAPLTDSARVRPSLEAHFMRAGLA